MAEAGVRIIVLAIFCFASVKPSAIPSSVAATIEDNPIIPYNEDADLTPRQLIKKYGYRGETHRVTTADGYTLEMHRITGHNSNPRPEGKQPILLMHGILASSVDWIISGPDAAFGYALADEGYDVWMGNARGNTFSRKHKQYTTIDKEFWQFSWHEIGIYDLPAMIDCVLEKSNRTQLIYAAHSQGTADFWVMATERPQYQKKVKAMFALAPVAYMQHVQSPFYKVVAKFGNKIETIMSLFGHYEFEPSSELVQELKAMLCHDGAITQPMCVNVIFLIAGYGSNQLNQTMLPAIVGHVPAGSSVRQMVHFAQLINSGKFRQWDYGVIGNLRKYKKLRPPAYDLSKIKTPVYLHYSSKDWFADPKDVDRLYRELGNPIGKFRVPDEEFTHLDFTWASEGRPLLYDKVIGMMQKYTD